MPFLGTSAIAHMGAFLEAIRTELEPRLRLRRTAVPVVPDSARHATINVNAVTGGQSGHSVQTPCVADRCSAILDRRFLVEEGFERTRAELVDLLEAIASRIPGFRYELRDVMVVEPVQTPSSSPLVATLARGIRQVLGREAALVASPGTYDHKHVTRLGGIEHCVAYGPGVLDLAHQPDEWCDLDDLVNATRVLALTLLDLVGPP
jgi:succinyl-diaminopimelate desuccinylase